MYLSRTTAQLLGCTFSENSAGALGGGIASWFASVTLSEVSLFENSASAGAGLQMDESTLSISRAIFEGNQARNNGGGAYIGSSEAELADCTVQGNNAGTTGGGMEVFSSTLHLERVAFRENVAEYSGGDSI